MNKLEIGTLSLKLAGIYIFFLAMPVLLSLAQLLDMMSWIPLGQAQEVQAQKRQYIFLFYASLSALLVYLFSSYVLFFKAEKISFFLFPKNQPDVDTAPVSKRNIQMIAFSIIGLFFLMDSIPNVFSSVSELIFAKINIPHLNMYRYLSERQVFPTLIGSTIQLLLGLRLFLGPKWLVGLWDRFQDLRPIRKKEEE
jgi:hypothetical protein